MRNPVRRVGVLVLVLLAGLVVPGYAQNDDGNPVHARDWRRSFAEFATNPADSIDEYAEVSWRRFVRRLNLNRPRHIAAYFGYSNGDRAWVQGRLLADRPYGGPADDDNWWDNLQATYGRWESDEIPDARVTLTYGDQRIEVKTDKEGYYAASFRLPANGPVADAIIARHETDDHVLTARHRVMLLDPSAEYLVISDMDDTVIHTGITQLLLSVRLTFLSNAKTRKPLSGVAELYQALQTGSDEERRNPIIYVSNSAWNLYDLLRDFIALNDIPPGPLLLRDVGFSDLWTKETGHKTRTVRNLLERYPDLPVVLIGDTGQHDAEIYAQIVAEKPGRVLAVYLRDVDPDENSEYDRAVDAVIERTRIHGVPFLRVADSAQIADHAAGIGLIPAAAIPRIRNDAERDDQRPSMAEASSPSGGH